jgi:hypothetical protein
MVEWQRGFPRAVSTVYDFDMSKYVYVQLYPSNGAPTPAPLKIRGDKFEKIESRVGAVENAKWVVSLDSHVVGEFHTAPLAWWIQDE